MHKTPRTLAEILAPASAKEFVQNQLGKTFHYFPGREGKFAALLPWPDLNQILRHHQLDTPRLRLVREGKPVAPETFINYRESRHRPGAQMTQLRSADLTRHLQDGATLVLDSVDELQEPVTALAESLEAALRARIQVNMYAGWRTSPGFDVHWDGHDVLILQLSGRKHWKVYPMTREHPLPGDPKTETPPQDPLWEGMLQDGDVLYIPRGWWHVAVPLNEPTLHLTVGIHQATGVDFLTWYADRLRSNASVRKDLPRLGTAADREASLRSLRDALQQAWRPELLDEYFAFADTRTHTRPHFGLPWTAEPAVLPPDESAWSLKWLPLRPIEWNRGDQNAIVVRVNGKEQSFAAAARPVLEALRENGACSMAQLSERTAGKLPPETLRIFVKELVNAGLVSIEANGVPQGH